MIEFNQEETIKKLKAEIGLSDIPDFDLYKYKVVLNSPTGQDETYTLTGAEYVANGIAEWKSAIEQTNKELESAESFLINQDPTQPIKQLEVPGKSDFSAVKFFDVEGDGTRYVVALNSESPTFDDEIFIIKNHRTYVGEHKYEDLTQFDSVISFSQWQGWLAYMDRNRPASTGLIENGQVQLKDLFDSLEMTMQTIGEDDTDLTQAGRFF